mmetsp:Transcript_28086/g.77298  ORF Transcript_28086/g.77298 Transcript_28086/m.77298 type:complete len:202 (+) Transcript_28086:574-1179(+)
MVKVFQSSSYRPLHLLHVGQCSWPGVCRRQLQQPQGQRAQENSVEVLLVEAAFHGHVELLGCNTVGPVVDRQLLERRAHCTGLAHLHAQVELSAAFGFHFQLARLHLDHGNVPLLDGYHGEDAGQDKHCRSGVGQVENPSAAQVQAGVPLQVPKPHQQVHSQPRHGAAEHLPAYRLQCSDRSGHKETRRKGSGGKQHQRDD